MTKLKLVPTSYSASEILATYEPQFLASQALLDRYWPQAAELLQPVVEKAMHGEMTLKDIYDRIVAGQMVCLVVKDDMRELPAVALALVLEVVEYPGFKALNVTAIGGQQLDLLKSRFWRHLCSWAYMSGIRTIQALVSPAMARIIGRYGFVPVYTVMRLPLTEM